MCCAMHLDDGFVFMDLVAAMLKVKAERNLRTVLKEYLAEWAFNEIVDMVGLW